jgi:hypothetical protein
MKTTLSFASSAASYSHFFPAATLVDLPRKPPICVSFRLELAAQKRG